MPPYDAVAPPFLICLAMAAGVPALALAQAQPMCGPSITADNAKKIAPAAIAEAKNNWTMAGGDRRHALASWCDSSGWTTVQQGSVDVAAIAKARPRRASSAPTKVFQDGLAAGGVGTAAAGARRRGAGGGRHSARGRRQDRRRDRLRPGGTSEQDGVVAARWRRSAEVVQGPRSRSRGRALDSAPISKRQ